MSSAAECGRCREDAAIECVQCLKPLSIPTDLGPVRTDKNGSRWQYYECKSCAYTIDVRLRVVDAELDATKRLEPFLSVARLLCEAAFVTDYSFICPPAFEDAVRAAWAVLRAIGSPDPEGTE
jgi:hypothetical protein